MSEIVIKFNFSSFLIHNSFFKVFSPPSFCEISKGIHFATLGEKTQTGDVFAKAWAKTLKQGKKNL